MKTYHYLLLIIFSCVLFIGIASCKKSGPTSPNESEEQPLEEVSFPVREHLIDIRAEGGAAKFYNEQSGEAFIPRGVNYFYIVSIPGGLEDRFFGVDVFDAYCPRTS